MDVAGAQVQVTTDHGEISHQVQNRLLHIDTQMAHIRAQVEQHIERSFNTLQELLAQREQHQTPSQHSLAEQLETVRQEARGELAAALLPALDSVDLALASGQALVVRQRQEIAAWEQQARAAQAPELPPPAARAWQKLRRTFAGQAVSVPLTPPVPCPLPEAV